MTDGRSEERAGPRWTAHLFLFRHSYGGTGCGSAHKLSSFLALPSVIPGSIECTETSLHYVTALCQKKSPRLCDYLPEQLHTVGGSEHPSMQFQRAYFQRIHKVPHQT